MNPLHWLARIHWNAPKLIVPDQFVLDFWWRPMKFLGFCWPKWWSLWKSVVGNHQRGSVAKTRKVRTSYTKPSLSSTNADFKPDQSQLLTHRAIFWYPESSALASQDAPSCCETISNGGVRGRKWITPKGTEFVVEVGPDRRIKDRIWHSTFRLDETSVFYIDAKQSTRNVRDLDSTYINNSF